MTLIQRSLSAAVASFRRSVIAYLALFVALGGTSYAAIRLPANAVGERQIKTNAVREPEIKRGAVRSPEVRDGSLLTRDFRPNQIPRGPKGDRGEQGVSEAYGAGGRGTSPSLPADGSSITVAALLLPPGSYVFSAEIGANSFAPTSRFIGCGLAANGAALTRAERGVTLIPDPGGATAGTVTIHDFRSLARVTRVEFRCDGQDVGAQIQANLFNPVLTATRVGSLR